MFNFMPWNKASSKIWDLYSFTHMMIHDFYLPFHPTFNLNAETLSSLWDDGDDEKLLKNPR